MLRSSPSPMHRIRMPQTMACSLPCGARIRQGNDVGRSNAHSSPAACEASAFRVVPRSHGVRPHFQASLATPAFNGNAVVPQDSQVGIHKEQHTHHACFCKLSPNLRVSSGSHTIHDLQGCWLLETNLRLPLIFMHIRSLPAIVLMYGPVIMAAVLGCIMQSKSTAGQ